MELNRERDRGLIDSDEVCKILHCAGQTSTVFRKFKKDAKAPRPVKMGRKLLWWAREIDDWLLAERERQTT